MKLKTLNAGRKSRYLPVKVTPEDYEVIKEKANQYTGGNVSEWVRYASTNLLPKSHDLTDDDGDDWN